MAIAVTMPKLTDSMEEGRIVEWKVSPGDRVNEGDVLAEIETDKAVMELESFWVGVVDEILRHNGDVVPVGEPIARISEQGERPQPAPERVEARGETERPSAEEEKPGPVPVADKRAPLPEQEEAPTQVAAGPAEAGVRASPRARKIARDKGIDLASVKASGEGGHVRVADLEPGLAGGAAPAPKEKARPKEAEPPPTRADLRIEPAARVLAEARKVDPGSIRGTGVGGRITVADVLGAAKAVPPAPAPAPSPPDRADEELPAVAFSPEEAEAEDVSFYQKAAIRRVVASKHVIPHFYVTKAVHADTLLKLQKKEKERSGATLTHYLMRACALALEKYPEANRSYDRGRWIRWKVVHLGLAVQTDAGLVVAVLRDAGGKDLGWLVENAAPLVERARQGKLKPAERINSTFTISNLGAFDVESFSAIINPPSAMTLAVGSVLHTPVVKEGEVVAGEVMHLTLSCDHRVVDGVLAARFLGEVKALLEDPEKL